MKKKSDIHLLRENVLVLSNRMLTNKDKEILRASTYETDDKTRDLRKKYGSSDDISSYCLNKPDWTEFVVYDLKFKRKRTGISDNIQNILNFANDMRCETVCFTTDGPFPNYIKLHNIDTPEKHTHPIIRKMYAPSIQSLKDDDITFLDNLAKTNLHGFYEKYCYGWFVDTRYESTIQTLCENKRVKRIILPYINAPYIHDVAILDLDAET